jgi:hypothetical protein
MSRRTKKIVGMVNFPVDLEEYKCSNEGGMFVELWVVEQEFMECGACCGYGNITSHYAESLVGTEQKPNHDNYSQMNEEELSKVFENDIGQRFFLEEELFPFMHSNEKENVERYQSFPLLACITMGSTGWSGYGGQHQDYWRCQYKDLNESGKLVYDTLEKQYPKAELLLVTWLDT